MDKYSEGDITCAMPGKNAQIRLYGNNGYFRLDTKTWHNVPKDDVRWDVDEHENVVITSDKLAEILEEAYDNSLRNPCKETP